MTIARLSVRIRSLPIGLPTAFGVCLVASWLFLPGPAAAQSPCTCRAAGTSWQLDACACLDTPDGPRRACYGKVLNNTAWKFTGERCPTALAPGIAPQRQAATASPPVPAAATPWHAAAAAR